MARVMSLALAWRGWHGWDLHSGLLYPLLRPFPSCPTISLGPTESLERELCHGTRPPMAGGLVQWVRCASEGAPAHSAMGEVPGLYEGLRIWR